jgi:hypothetical protein
MGTTKVRGKEGLEDEVYIRAWDHFAVMQGTKSFKTMTATDAMNTEHWKAWTSWLFDPQGHRNDKGEKLSLSSMEKYLTGVIMECRHKFRGDQAAVVFFAENVPWYAQLRADLKAACVKKGFTNDECVEERTIPAGQDEVVGVVEWLLQQNDSSRVKGAFACCMTWNAIGRSGESCYSSFNENCFWDAEQKAMTMEWSQSKTGRADPMTFFHHYEHMELDWYFMFAVYSISCAAETGGNNRWLFPQFLNISRESVAQKVNDYFKEAAAALGLNENFTATSMRVGSFNRILMHAGCKAEWAIIRGGWVYSHLTTAWVYIISMLVFLAIAGRALCGWPAPELVIYPAELTYVLVDLDVNQQQVLWNYIHLIMPITSKFGQSYKRQLSEVMFASLLLY